MGDIFKPLTGYSGAQIYMATTPGRAKYVRKIAARSELNDRLVLQMRRQLYFERLDDRAFHVPAVLDEGRQGDLYFFDMEFVDAVDGAYFLASANFLQIRTFCANFTGLLQFLATRDSDISVPQSPVELLSDKVNTVTTKDTRLSGEIKERILQGLDRLRRQEAQHLHKGTLYHGDLTLENILVTRDSGIVLLDFLDSPLPHYWQDLSKIHMDLESHWYARRHRRISEWVVCYLREEFMTLAKRQNPQYPEFHPLLLAINLLRVLPYARNSADKEFLLNHIGHQASQIQL